MTPVCRLTIAGAVVPLHGRLLRMTLSDKTGLDADRLTLDIDDSDGDIVLPRRGVTLGCAFGFDGQTQNKGDYIVDELAHHGPPDRITLRARSADFRDNLMRQRETSYHGTTLGAILSTIAARNRLDPAVAEDYENRAIPHLDQTNESDANLITRLGRDHGALATIKSGRLLFLPRAGGKTARGKALPAVTIVRGDGDRHHFSVTDRQARISGVTAYWQDKTHARREPVHLGKAGYRRSLRGTYASAEAAETAARGQWNRLRSGNSRLTLALALGRSDLFAACPVRVQGFKAEIDALDWCIVEVTHSLDARGYTCALELERIVDEAAPQATPSSLQE